MTLCRLFAALVLLCLAVLPAAGQEEIRAFSSDITLLRDGSVHVVETLDVNAEGRDIQRGIYRDIPVVMRDDDGNRVRTNLAIVSVTRAGNPEPFRIERQGDFRRIRIGNANQLLDIGVHRYVITYEMTRMGRSFEGYGELYWNATGHYWNFPILAASATVRLPEGAVLGDIAAYAGPVGSTDVVRLVGGAGDRMAADQVVLRRVSDTVATIEVGRVLAPGEGLTIAAAFPVGVLERPVGMAAVLRWLDDRQGMAVPILCVLLVLGYFSVAWLRVGRDPRRGIIIPLFHAPEGFSPGLVHYVHHWGWTDTGWKALTAAVFSLGARGLVQIDNTDQKLSLSSAGEGKEPAADLPSGEAALYTFINARGTVAIDKVSGPDLDTARSDFVRAIERENEGVWFHHNRGHMLIGLILSFVLIVYMASPTDYIDPVWMLFSAVVGLVAALTLAWLFLLRSGRVFCAGLLLVWGVVALVLADGMGEFSTRLILSPAMIAATAILALCGLFRFLMGAATVPGRAAMDRIDGLKLYMETAEKDRMNITGEPPMTVARFERLLPYAIALGVEKPWSEHFEAELARNAVADAQSGHYRPNWDRARSRSLSPGRIAAAVSGAATGMSAAMAAAQPVSSGSSGSGGGGRSGGGGGGGGGGGW